MSKAGRGVGAVGFLVYCLYSLSSGTENSHVFNFSPSSYIMKLPVFET